MPVGSGQPFAVQAAHLVEALLQLLEPFAVDLLSLEGPDLDRLFEPAPRQGVVARPQAEPEVDHPLQAGDVAADLVQIGAGQVQAGQLADLGGEILQVGGGGRIEQLGVEAAHADGVTGGEGVLAAPYGVFLAVVGGRLGRDLATVQGGLEGRIVVDPGVDLQGGAVAQVVHAAGGDRQAEGEGLENAGVVRIGLEQPLGRHAVVEGLGRIAAHGDRPAGAGDGVAEAFALRGHEQQLFDHRIVAPGQFQPAGVLPVDDAALVELHRPGDGAAGAGGVEGEVVDDVVQPQHLLRLADADVGPELADGDVFRPFALVVAVEHPVTVDAVVGALPAVFEPALLPVVAGVPGKAGQGAGAPASLAAGQHVVVGPAADGALVAAAHPRPVGVEIVGVEAVVPGGLLVVLGSHGAEHPARLVEEGGPHLLQGVLHHAGGEGLAGDLAVAGDERLRQFDSGWPALQQNRLQAQRAHLGTAATPAPDRLDAPHDAAAQHQVLAGAADARHRHVLLLAAGEILFDALGEIEIVQADIGRGVEKVDLAVPQAQQGPLPVPAVEHQMVVTLQLEKGGEEVTGVAVEDRPALGRQAGDVAAGGPRHPAGEGPGPEDQRHLGVEGLAYVGQQVVEQKHVAAAPAEKATDHVRRQVGVAGVAPLEVDEQHRALAGKLRPVVQPRQQPLHTLSGIHGCSRISEDCPTGTAAAVQNSSIGHVTLCITALVTEPNRMSLTSPPPSCRAITSRKISSSASIFLITATGSPLSSRSSGLNPA